MMAGFTRWLSTNNTMVWNNCALSAQYNCALSDNCGGNGIAAVKNNYAHAHTRLRSFLHHTLSIEQ